MKTLAPIAALERLSFSDEAARSILAQAPHREILYGKTINDVWRMMQQEDAYALLPFENSSGGVVWPHLDLLRSEQLASIVGEVQLKVRLCAGGLDPDALEQARIACSHAKGLEQSTNFQARLPHLEGTKGFPTTVDAVRYVKEQNDPRNIALASRLAIEELGLLLLQEDVANDKDGENITQFFLVHRNGAEPLPNPEAQYHAAFLIPENQRGILNRITSIIDNARVDLTSLHSRPIGNKQYGFYVEMTREGKPEEFELMARQLAHHAKIVRWLGSWNDRWEN